MLSLSKLGVEPEARKRINRMILWISLVIWGIPVMLFIFLMFFFPNG